MRKIALCFLLASIGASCSEDATPGESRPDAGRDATTGGHNPILDGSTGPVDAGRRLGSFGDPCSEGRECLSGYCIESIEGGRICTRTCGESCPPGYECNFVGNAGADRLFLCIADVPDVCKPCERDRECDDNEDLCLRIGNSTYCGEDCSQTGRCPDNFECVDIEREGDGDAGVITFRQCVPAGGEGCLPCVDNDGDGYGVGGDCLGFDCNDDDPNVYEGAPELCDGKDNNCNSLVDEPNLLEDAPDNIFCLNEGVCRGTRVECIRGDWACDYSEAYEPNQERSCDGLDNDCDGEVDENFDTTSDANHCGFCGNRCTFPNASGVCVESLCQLGDCDEGWYNNDRNDGNGCEYACNLTREGIEVCDDIDNDCDGLVDEGFDTQRSAAHCGGCNRACELERAVPGCEEGVCTVAECEEGWVNLDADARNGCEYACVPSNEGAEICDTLDNDCDGRVDEDFDLDASLAHCGRCNRVCAFPNAQAVCDAGQCRMSDCQFSYWDLNRDAADGCEYQCILTHGGVEVCDGIDNNCNGLVDEGFDLQTDPSHCGACGRTCIYPNGVPGCDGGECVLAGCQPGWYDIDASPINGCEYSCDGDPAAPETCNQLDDDCDGRIDEDFNLLVDVNHCGRCNNTCVLPNAEPRCAQGSCAIAQCVGGFHDVDGLPDNGCEYACTPTNGGVEICDGIDNDCNGEIDDRIAVNDDPQNCGGCGQACVYPNGVPGCADGQCRLLDCLPGFVDLDGSPANGCEYACNRVSDVDAPDPAGVDANCDGIDGDMRRAVFVRTNGNDGLDGLAPDRAVATLAAAIAIARANPARDQILIATGTYRINNPLTLQGGMTLHGGYSPNFRARGAERALVIAESSVAANAIDLDGPVLLDRVDLEVTNRVTAGQAAIALRVSSSAEHVSLREVHLLAGRGGAGTDGSGGSIGATGSRGADGNDSSGGNGGGPGGGKGADGRRRAVGLPGEAGAPNGSDCGGTAGAGSGSAGMGCNDGDPRPGGNAGDGCVGRPGGHGNAGSNVGSWVGVTWFAQGAGGGGQGLTGGGGGGGGAGGGEDCRVLGQCVYCGTGRGGGGGGGGGTGGSGGTGATSGGASVGLAVNNSTVTLTDVTITTADGGAGGRGGNGGPGGPGGTGGFGATNNSNTDGNGGNGGNGGVGGVGGCGGGGGGGPSVPLWGIANAVAVQRGDIDYINGPGGAGGASCGNPGDRGLSAQTQNIALR